MTGFKDCTFAYYVLKSIFAAAPVSLLRFDSKNSQGLYRWTKIVSSADCSRVIGERGSNTIFRSRHPGQHPRQYLLISAEAHEYGTMRTRSPKRRIAPENMLLLAVLLDDCP